MAFEFIELSKPAIDSLSDEEHAALESLSKDKTIIITKADQGNAVVIQNVVDYTTKVQDLLRSGNKFVELGDNPTVKRETKLQCTLRAIRKRKEITSEVYKRVGLELE